MFSYYGSKSKIIKLYPKPKYDIIIEPFAGTARYALQYNDKQITLNEKYEIIYSIWKWLITKATKEEILNNRDFYLKQDIRLLQLVQEHKNLIGFCINRGSAQPHNIVQKWSCQVKSNPQWASTSHYALTTIANNLNKVKHWNIVFGDYTKLDNIEATWFIDPPYQYGGKYYIENDINYKLLAEWCLSRKGQVIVCENDKAKWLDFKPLKKVYGQRKNNIETIYTND